MALVAVDVVDADAAARAPLLQALHGAGFQVRTYPLEQLPIAFAKLRPQLLIATGEPGTPQVDRLLLGLGQLQCAWLPVVLLAQDDADRTFSQDFKTGVVEIWRSGPPTQLAQKLAALVADLPERSNSWQAAGDGKTLAAFLAYARRTLRTGVLSVVDKQGGEGQVSLVAGLVRASAYQGRAKQDALKALSVLSSARFEFSQPQHSAEPGVVVAVEEDEAPAIESLSGTPAAAPAPASAARPAPSLAASEAGPITLEPVLLVDDDADLRKLFSTYFGKKGYQVRTAEDGAKALSAAAMELPGLVLADLNMPHIDGWSLLRFLREDVRTREVPVALFSCHDHYRESLRALQAGAQAFYPKSLRLDALEAQVRELLEPRARFRRIVSGKQSLTVDVGALGPAWCLRTLGTLQFTGILDAADSWARLRLTFVRGQLTSASARTGNQNADGDRALAAFLVLKNAEGSFAFDAGSGLAAQAEPVEQAVARVLEGLAAQQAAARATMLRDAKGYEVNPDLYALYLQVGPPRLRDATRALCEHRLPARDVAERAGLSMQEMEAFVLDLVRRGVVRLQS